MLLEDYRNERLRKLDEIKSLGINPYPSKSNRDTKIGDILADFGTFDGQTVTISGRITAIRSFGKLAFVKLLDDSGEIQVFMTAKDLADDAKVFNTKRLKLLDTGDFVEASGQVGKSSTGELSVFSNTLRLLTKTLRPLPGRDGFTNKEERYRRRYVDMNVNPEVRARLVRRSKFWQATRDFMLSHGFVEVNVIYGFSSSFSKSEIFIELNIFLISSTNLSNQLTFEPYSTHIFFITSSIEQNSKHSCVNMF